MNGTEKKKSTPADKAVNAVITLLIVGFLAVGVYATYGKISDGIKENRIEEGKEEATVSYLAKQANLDTESYLEQYGLTLGDTVTEDTTESEMLDNMTIENYASYNGQDAETFMQGLSESVTKDTVWKDFMAMPVKDVINADDLAAVKEQYGITDEEVSDTTSYEDFQTVLYQKAIEQQSQTAAQDDTADNASEADGE